MSIYEENFEDKEIETGRENTVIFTFKYPSISTIVSIMELEVPINTYIINGIEYITCHFIF